MSHHLSVDHSPGGLGTRNYFNREREREKYLYKTKPRQHCDCSVLTTQSDIGNTPEDNHKHQQPPRESSTLSILKFLPASLVIGVTGTWGCLF